jgi:hypothetical protein
MRYVFLSHASEDKAHRVKPLVEALVMEGVKLWIDRPGYGENHFNFDRDFIDRYLVEGLRAGEPFNVQISRALHDAGAVLVCLSAALCAQRQVLVQELLLGWHHNKLVACIVDDLSYSQIPSDLGLPDVSRLQAERIDPEILRQAVDWLLEHDSCKADILPPNLKGQWEIVRKLVHDINVILDRTGPRLPSVDEMTAARTALSAVPIGPMVRAHEIPVEIIGIFAERFGDPDGAKNFLSQAMNLLGQCNPENFTERQILVRSGEVLNPHSVTAEDYWGDVLTVAGMKSRRSLASFLIVPGAPTPEMLRRELGSILMDFRKWLERPEV